MKHAEKAAIFAILAGWGLAACSTSEEIPKLRGNTPPVVVAGDDQMIDESVIGVIQANIEDKNISDLVNVKWEQIQGPAVELAGATVPRAVFTAPDVDKTTDLVFRVTADDGFNPPVSDEITVRVKNVPGDMSAASLNEAG